MEHGFWNSFHDQCASVDFGSDEKNLRQTMAKIKYILFLIMNLIMKQMTT